MAVTANGWYTLDAVKPREVSITFGDEIYRFKSSLRPVDQFAYPIANTRMTFTNLPGTYGKLEIDGEDQAEVYGSTGFVDLIDMVTFDYFNPTRFRFTTAEGDLYVIDETDGVQSMRDRHGNTLSISRNGVFHSSGVNIAFVRDSTGRIAEIVDPAGHKLSYTYDEHGNLASFTDRELNTNSFAYTNVAFPHYLTGIVDPRGVTAIRNEFDENGLLARQVDGAGHAIEFTHDLAQNREITRDRLGHVTIHEYDANGNITRTTDALESVTLFKFDALDNLIEQVDALNNTNRFTYDLSGNKLTETDSLGNVTQWTYDGFRQITSIKDARGNVSSNIYNAVTGELVEERDAMGKATRNSYDLSGNLTSRKDALGNITTNQYDRLGNVTNTAVIDVQLGVISQAWFTYDTNGNQLTKTSKRTTAAGEEILVTSYQYDKENRLVQTIHPDGSTNQIIYAIGLDKPAVTIDELGRETRYQYDLRGNLALTTFPDGTTETVDHDAEGRKISLIDKGGRITLYTNDALGRLTTIVYPNGATTNTFYDDIGRVIATQDERGNVTRFGYDPHCGCSSRQSFVTNALSQVTIRKYDKNGNESEVTDALNRTTRFVYDVLDRRTHVLFHDGSEQVTGYDFLGRRISETDQAGKTTYYGYDATERLTSVTNAIGGVTRYAYNKQGNLVSQTDANTHTTTFEYDSVGRRVKRTLPLGQSELYAYDAAGNMTNKVDFNGKQTTYTYDSMNRLLSKLPDPTIGGTPITFTYSASGERATMSDASGLTTYRYNDRDWLTNKTVFGGTPYATTLEYDYDAHGNLTGIRSSNENGTDINYEFDALNRLSSANDAKVGRTTYVYDDVGNLLHYTYPNGVTTSYAYDSLYRLTNMAAAKLATSVASYQYEVNASGHRTGAVETVYIDGAAHTIDRLYTYDDLYRLTGETVKIGTAPSAALTYQYDAVGNRLTRTSTLNPIPSSGYGYDANDRLTSDTYDANGNTRAALLRDTETGSEYPVSDTYDFEDRLIARQATQPTGTKNITLVYDGDGNRVGKTVNGVTTIYLVDDKNHTGYAQVLEELTVTGSTQSIVRVYGYGSDLISQDQLVGVDWTTSFYGYDGHGNVTYLTTCGGIAGDTYSYDAFGALVSRTSDASNLYLYNGEQFDFDLNLCFLRARYLDPDGGRFWTQDPYEGAAKIPFSLHKYVFGYADPVNRIDPSGNFVPLSVGEVVLVSGFNNRQQAQNAQRNKRKYDAVRKGLCATGNAGIANAHHALPMFVGGVDAGINLVPGLGAVPHTQLHQLLHYALRFVGFAGGNVRPDKYAWIFHVNGNQRQLVHVIVREVARDFDKVCVPKGTPAVLPTVERQIQHGLWNF